MPLFYRDLHLRALEAAYHRHYDQLCAVAAAVLGGDAALAQDAVQEAWLRLNAPGVRERIRTDDTDRLRGLLLVTVRNAARTMLTDATDGHLDKTLVVESKEDITLEEMKGYNFLFYPAADAYYEVTYTGELAETAYRIIQNMD